MLKVSSDIQIPLTEFRFTFARSPGPGGQNVNKVNTKAVLKWDVEATSSLPDGVKIRFQKKYARRISKIGELTLTSHRYRDQGRNVADCLNKLRDLIEAVRLPPVLRKARKVSKGAKQRRLDAKKKNSATKQNRRAPRIDE
jgi:ribosome-associated protein